MNVLLPMYVLWVCITYDLWPGLWAYTGVLPEYYRSITGVLRCITGVLPTYYLVKKKFPIIFRIATEHFGNYSYSAVWFVAFSFNGHFRSNLLGAYFNNCSYAYIHIYIYFLITFFLKEYLFKKIVNKIYCFSL